MNMLSTETAKIDFEKIGQKKIKKFLTTFNLTTVDGFKKVKSLCYHTSSAETYRTHVKSYLIKKNVEEVWDTYKNIHPREAWGGKAVSFGLQFSKTSNTVTYLHDPYTGIEKGHVIILHLQFIGGIIKIAVAHEVSEVNEHEKLIKLCYVEGGVTEGSQWVTLQETKEGFTKVSHLSLYKSKSKFRDTFLYPWFHTLVLNEFHQNVKHKIESALK